ERAIYLLSGLTQCDCCGSSYAMYNRARLAGSGSSERCICTDRLTIRREDVETRVLRAMQERLWRAEPFDAYCRRLTERLNQLRQDERAAAAADAQELARVEREITQLVRLLKDGLDAPSGRDELLAPQRPTSAAAAR